MIPVRGPAHLLLPMKRCTVFNAMIGRMAKQIYALLQQDVLVVFVFFLSLSSFITKEFTASSRRKRGRKVASASGIS